jgi:excisionase family DNA binding protein
MKIHDPEPPQRLTSREAARTLAVGERTLWGLTRRGQVPCVRIGRAVRYDRRDLRDFIERHKGADRSDVSGPG